MFLRKRELQNLKLRVKYKDMAKTKLFKNGNARVGNTFFGKEKKSKGFTTRKINSGPNKGKTALWF